MTEDEIAEQHHRLDGCEFELRELVMDRVRLTRQPASLGSQVQPYDTIAVWVVILPPCQVCLLLFKHLWG